MIHPHYLERVISELRQEDAIVIVEGKRDVNALTRIGINKDSILKSAQTPFSSMERSLLYKDKTIIPLFDNDRSGKNRLKGFIGYFNGFGLRIDMSYSKKLREAGITYIEEIDNALGF